MEREFSPKEESDAEDIYHFEPPFCFGVSVYVTLYIHYLHVQSHNSLRICVILFFALFVTNQSQSIFNTCFAVSNTMFASCSEPLTSIE